MEIATNNNGLGDIKSEFRNVALAINNYVTGNIEESEASTEIINWILKPSRTPKQVVFMVSDLFLSVFEGKSLPSKLTRTWLILTTLEGLSRRPGLVLEDAWVYVLVWLVKFSEDFEYDKVDGIFLRWIRLVSSLQWVNVWDWIIDAVCSAELCPYPYLRLELFRLGHVFNQNFITLDSAPRLMEGLVNIFSSIDNCDQLFTAAEDKLLCAPAHILPFLNWSEVRDHLINEIVTDVECLIWPTNDFKHCGRHILFFVNLLKFVKKSADLAKRKYKSDGNKLRKSLNQCLLLFIFGFNNLTDFNTFTMSEFHAVYRHPMVLPNAMDALASINDASLSVSGLINSRPQELLVIGEDHRNEIDEEFNQLKCRRRNLLNKLLMRHDFIINVLGLHATSTCFTDTLVKREIHGCNAGFIETFEHKACQQLMFSSVKLMLSNTDVCSAFDFEVGEEDEKYIDEIIDFGSIENEEVEDVDLDEEGMAYEGEIDEEEGMHEGDIEEEDEDSYDEEDYEIIELGSEDTDTSEDEEEN